MNLFCLFTYPDVEQSKFEKKTISETYREELQEFDLWVRPVWTWIQDML